MKATLILRDRARLTDTLFAEAVVWRVPKPVPPSEHSFKYRLVLIHEGERVIGYDNERGKGDHRHIDGREEPYAFESVDRLLNDFATAIEQWRRNNDQ